MAAAPATRSRNCRALNGSVGPSLAGLKSLVLRRRACCRTGPAIEIDWPDGPARLFPMDGDDRSGTDQTEARDSPPIFLPWTVSEAEPPCGRAGSPGGLDHRRTDWPPRSTGAGQPAGRPRCPGGLEGYPGPHRTADREEHGQRDGRGHRLFSGLVALVPGAGGGDLDRGDPHDPGVVNEADRAGAGVSASGRGGHPESQAAGHRLAHPGGGLGCVRCGSAAEPLFGSRGVKQPDRGDHTRLITRTRPRLSVAMSWRWRGRCCWPAPAILALGELVLTPALLSIFGFAGKCRCFWDAGHLPACWLWHSWCLWVSSNRYGAGASAGECGAGSSPEAVCATGQMACGVGRCSRSM